MARGLRPLRATAEELQETKAWFKANDPEFAAIMDVAATLEVMTGLPDKSLG